MEGKMIDIISSSIRLGKLLREHSELNDIAVFFSQIENEKSKTKFYTKKHPHCPYCSGKAVSYQQIGDTALYGN